jgi:hypothetical protein
VICEIRVICGPGDTRLSVDQTNPSLNSSQYLQRCLDTPR